MVGISHWLRVLCIREEASHHSERKFQVDTLKQHVGYKGRGFLVSLFKSHTPRMHKMSRATFHGFPDPSEMALQPGVMHRL